MADDIEITQTEETITGDKSTNAAQPAPQAATSLSQEERDLIAAMPYEEARDKLVQAVRALENGGLSLDQSMRQWEIGEALAQRAESLLADVRARLDAAQAQQAQTASTAGTQENLQ
ncbi:exonuclease VII small subunit [Bifidobacterium pseudolongum subsp. globosum]|uniref:Exodeoxyribonuclease 7 small subunit n=1 Tax=Bifidobacterium pseudolongum subsp. globosum TaxID=1690 RepID=A0A2N3QEF5_9BIFI|nr:exodeoxyribonuclease VII small subunit [Bifidobacterium pseudolongum]PKU88490.1 exonuclease VII small subunit [Bifidobacterium pseudolongum subsp. globosum]